MTNLRARVFPPESRTFPGKRWLETGFRTAHLVGTAGIGGGFLWGAAPQHWLPFLWLTVVTGAAMAALQIWGNGVWLIQVRGLAVIAKLALLGVMVAGDVRADLFILVLVISGVVSHAPARLRYFSPLYMRRIDHL
ncbi:hypothetical protein QWY84_04535 [Aquisalimonas lutea]|uniref:hypothetical protein n=1 Tax=Aquisalimonas lutea TaxID=1327750 RepID=UPI0025B3694C|nr:hypothetical protein [Aquisalimonas lutea]MDN3516875.1 hypothetical protein [Aquisalimonas lutea]